LLSVLPGSAQARSQVSEKRRGIRLVNRGGAGGFVSPGNTFSPLEKGAGYSLKNLGPSQKTHRPPGVPSWLWAWAKYIFRGERFLFIIYA